MKASLFLWMCEVVISATAFTAVLRISCAVLGAMRRVNG